MSLDVHNPKITWAVLFTVATLVFYSGGLTYQINQNEMTNVTQWRYINKNGDGVEALGHDSAKIEALSNSLNEMKASNNALTSAVTQLTITMGSREMQDSRAKEDRAKLDAFMLRVSAELSDVKVKVTRIEATQAKKP